MTTEYTGYLDSPLGIIEIKGTASFISAVNFITDKGEDSVSLPPNIIRCKQELEEYFAGERTSFSVETEPAGTTFQKGVWEELKKIKYGETKSYGSIARQMKDAGASRAIGNANGKNPLAIIVPCHRVIGENGKLTGYAGGLWRKQWLLEHEGNISGRKPTFLF